MGFDGHFLRSQTHLLVTATADLTVAKRIEPLLVHLRAAEDWICCQKRGVGRAGILAWGEVLGLAVGDNIHHTV